MVERPRRRDEPSMTFFLLITLMLFLLCSQSLSWGPATHVELAQSVLSRLSSLGSGLADLLGRYRRDFLFGNVFADVIIAKKLSPRRQAAHNWDAGRRALTNADDDRSRAFAYGFLTHLAADTVAHNLYIPSLIRQTGSSVTLGHLYWELRADRLVAPEHRTTARRLLRLRKPDHDQAIADHVFPEVKWLGLNRGIFTRTNRITNGPNFGRAMGVWEDISRWQLLPETIQRHKSDACDRMIDLLLNGHASALLQEDPNGLAVLQRLRDQRRSA